MNKTDKTAIIYCRVSTTKQENHGSSLANQEEACRRYCKENWLQVLRVFNEAFTWKSILRPILTESIKYAKENNVSHFIIFDIDRFMRKWFDAYSEVKKELETYNIKLKDCKNIIWDNRTVIENDIIDMSQYQWNIENSSEIAEVMVSTQAKMEWKKILQRTIPKEILLEQQWYQVRDTNYWYQNKRIPTHEWRKTIQVKHPIEWDFVIEMFEKRAEWIMSDKEIVNRLVLKWCNQEK